MEVSIHSWILVALFAINLIFMFVMTLVSTYYKKVFSEGWGRLMNIIWMIFIITLTGLYLFYNMSCLVSDKPCTWLAWLTIAIVTILTIWIIVYSLIMDSRYREIKAVPVFGETI